MKRSRAGIYLVAFLWVAFALNYVDRQMVYSMFPALRADLGFTEDRLGLIGSVFLWVIPAWNAHRRATCRHGKT